MLDSGSHSQGLGPSCVNVWSVSQGRMIVNSQGLRTRSGKRKPLGHVVSQHVAVLGCVPEDVPRLIQI